MQICNGVRIKMAFCTRRYFSVFATQLKRKTRMSEIITIFINAIMASKAVRPEGQGMCLSESNVDLTVATIAGV